MADTGNQHKALSAETRLSYVEVKVSNLEKSTQRAFEAAEKSSTAVNESVRALDKTIALLNDRMVTQKDCASVREECRDHREHSEALLEAKILDLEHQGSIAKAMREATEPNIKLAQLTGKPAKPEKSLTEQIKSWAGVVAAVVALGGFGTVATCTSSAYRAVRQDLLVSRQEVASQQRSVQLQLSEIKESQPIAVPVAMPVPVVAPRRSARTRPAGPAVRTKRAP